MLVRIYARLKSEGAMALINTIYRRVFPGRLAYYPHLKTLIESKSVLEIGGPSNIFKNGNIIPVYSIAGRIDNCNFERNTIWEGNISEGNTFFFHKRKKPGCQYICEASDLSCIASESYDCVLSSHCIEHLANPLRAIEEWIRVLKEDGLLMLIVPHKDATFDHRRPVTLLEHLIQDYKCQIDECDMTHLDEILRLHDLTKDTEAGDLQAFAERSAKNQENRCLHHHVFDTNLTVEMVHYMGLQILAVETFLPCHIVVLGKKLKQGQQSENNRFRSMHATPCWRSPFQSDNL